METDLNPELPRKAGDKGFKPAVYSGSGETPLEFDHDQGWEVATTHGAHLDLAIRNVGSAVEALAIQRRPPSSLTLEQIASMSGDLNQRELNLFGPGLEHLREEERRSNQGLAEALQLHPSQSTIFTSRNRYEQYVKDTLAHVSSAIQRQNALGFGDNKPDVLDLDTKPVYERAKEPLEREIRRMTAGDGPQSAWAKHEARLDSQARLEALMEVRGIGGHYADSFLREGHDRPRRFRKPGYPTSANSQFAKRMIESTSASLPRDWIEKAGQGPYLKVRVGKTLDKGVEASRWTSSHKRGGPINPEIRLSPQPQPDQGPMTGWESDALHEMGHHMEFIYPEINQIARTHKALRTTGPDGRLDEIECIVPSSKEELPPRPERMDATNDYTGWGRPSTFAATYAGQETGPGASEVFSTGLEAAIGGRYGSLRGHGGVKADPEHLHLILGILATVGRR